MFSYLTEHFTSTTSTINEMKLDAGNRHLFSSSPYKWRQKHKKKQLDNVKY